VKRLLLLVGVALVPLLLIVVAVVAYVGIGVIAGGRDATGVLSGTGVRAPVRIVRDARGIPHVRAQNERDAFFAEGYLQGSDRLFQIDLYRRVVAGRLAEVFGSKALATDEDSRIFDPVGLATEEERRLKPALRADLQAFADGVNFAMRTRPLPPEFRILGYRPEPWTPRDSLLAATSTVLTLADRWYDVGTRIAIGDAYGNEVRNAFYPLSDPKYDVPIAGTKPAPLAPLPRLRSIPFPDASPLALRRESAREGLGSNDFAAGAALTATHRALLANDPHLDLHMPGVWYLADLASPTMHVAGATLAGVPGIILGHNAHLAWGSTNGTIASTALYRERFRNTDSDEYLAGGRWVHATHRVEIFKVRFGKNATRDYLSTRHGFVVGSGALRYAVAWTGERDKRAGFETFYELTQARDVRAAFRVLDAYPGPAQNFVLADDAGNAGYALAGDVWLDDAWGLKAHDGAKESAKLGVVPYARLPKVAPSRDALVFTANNQTYGAGYRYRLSSNFAPPYRAARIAQRLHAMRNYDVADFSSIQADVTSLAERELARAAAAAALARKGIALDSQLAAMAQALNGFDGRFVSDSKAAAYASYLRRAASERLVRIHLGRDLGVAYLDGNYGTALELVLRVLREHPRGWVPHDDYDQFLRDSAREAEAKMKAQNRIGATWGDVGARTARHALASLGIGWWDGVRFPGNGDGYSPHVQGSGVTQSFRAVWDVGNWDAGGMVIPQGESGQPGSPHYRDGAAPWLAGTLIPLPFTERAVTAAARETLELRP
jgi:penicillin amidase